MGNVICPLSKEKVDQHVIRLTGFCMVLCIVTYLYTNNILPIIVITIDYGIRAFTSGKLSPFATISSGLFCSTTLGLQPKLINKAPKIFASRVGFLFASTSTILYFLKGYVLESQYVAGTLMIFALLESLGNFCFGCVVYQYMILPIFGPSTATTDNNNNNSNDNKSK